jgi:predicted MFS family arabinose efflux permease
MTAPATIIAPLIGGRIADTHGFIFTFAWSALLAVAMMAILIFLVKEPRKIIRAGEAAGVGMPKVTPSDPT